MGILAVVVMLIGGLVSILIIVNLHKEPLRMTYAFGEGEVEKITQNKLVSLAVSEYLEVKRTNINFPSNIVLEGDQQRYLQRLSKTLHRDMRLTLTYILNSALDGKTKLKVRENRILEVSSYQEIYFTENHILCLCTMLDLGKFSYDKHYEFSYGDVVTIKLQGDE